MPSFAFESGYLVPASIGQPSTSPLTPEVRRALRDYLLDVIEADLFPIEWSGEDDPVLTAMDVAGQVVTAVVTDKLDGDRLLSALTRAGEATASPWLTIAGRYHSGVGGFRRDWNAFRESRPAGAQPGPQLYVVAGEVTREVLEATRVLHGVQVFAVDARESSTGQQLLDVTPVQPATIRVLEGAVVHEIEPAITAASPGPALSAPTPVAADVARTAEEPPEPETPGSADPAEPVPEESELAAGAGAVAVPADSVPARAAPFPERSPATAPEPEPETDPVDPQLRAVAQLVGAPMPIELRHAGQVQHAVLTAEGALQVGEARVATIERATEILGGEPSHAWTAWHVAGFPMADARAEATRAPAPVRSARRRRRAG
ncbi:MAG TPA: hypothetical protein H9815_08960 [Candidatus Ruania gallistercoris]|uniref:RAMA domain-containing protein n=1 Tax=Candidatus Ruania gallistercoris TaxID=2838746 RepID=A0A9D2EEK4_9MICO|nr:hypothetical protein [Candidatus Ruania gallistercoris]